MNIRVLAATLAGAIVMFFGGWLIFGLLLMNYMKANTIQYAGLMKEPMPDMIPLIVANLAFAWLLAFVFDYWARIRTFVSGLKGGAIIILPIAIWIDSSFLSFMNLYTGIVPVIVDIIASTILGAITGGVVGLVLGLLDKRTELE